MCRRLLLWEASLLSRPSRGFPAGVLSAEEGTWERSMASVAGKPRQKRASSCSPATAAATSMRAAVLHMHKMHSR